MLSYMMIVTLLTKHLLVFQDIREKVKEKGKPHAGALSVSLACCLFRGLS